MVVSEAFYRYLSNNIRFYYKFCLDMATKCVFVLQKYLLYIAFRVYSQSNSQLRNEMDKFPALTWQPMSRYNQEKNKIEVYSSLARIERGIERVLNERIYQ